MKELRFICKLKQREKIFFFFFMHLFLFYNFFLLDFFLSGYKIIYNGSCISNLIIGLIICARLMT
jgi:hypothetical protein